MATGESLPDYTVCTLADDILNIVLLTDVERDLARPRGVGGVRSRHGADEIEGNGSRELESDKMARGFRIGGG